MWIGYSMHCRALLEEWVMDECRVLADERRMETVN